MHEPPVAGVGDVIYAVAVWADAVNDGEEPMAAWDRLVAPARARLMAKAKACATVNGELPRSRTVSAGAGSYSLR
jgi:hypothetical protein